MGSEEPGRPVGRESGGRTKRVLLVDDHDLFRQVLAVIFEQHAGIDETLQADSIAEAYTAVDELDDNLLALAVVDLDLPEGDVSGLIGELCRKNIPVLAMAAGRNPGCLGQSSGADELLTTAASSDDVLGVARKLIGG